MLLYISNGVMAGFYGRWFQRGKGIKVSRLEIKLEVLCYESSKCQHINEYP